ncbi:MAG: NYN domain-containing protein [Planctomycetota bacterium]
METLIDGYNLLMKIGRLADKLRGGEILRSREMLLYMLARAKRKDLNAATVVFDSKRLKPGRLAEPEGTSLHIRRERRGGLGVIFSPPGTDADTVIKEYLEERVLLGKGGEVLLVTSDRQLAAYARSVGARIETSDECAKYLVGHRRPRHGKRRKRERPEPGKELAAPTDEEVEAWLRYFDMEGDAAVEL